MNTKELIEQLEKLPNLPIKFVQDVHFKEIERISHENNALILY